MWSGIEHNGHVHAYVSGDRIDALYGRVGSANSDYTFRIRSAKEWQQV